MTMLTHARAQALVGALCAAVTLSACSEDPAETHHRVAVDLFAKGEYAKAAAEYDEVFKLNPKLDEKIQKKGAQAWSKAGEYGKAAAILERIANTKAGAEKLDGYREIAGMYMQMANDLDTAEKWFSKVLEADPKDDQSLSWLAEIASTRGGARAAGALAKPDQLDLALARYDKAIALKPDAVGTYVNKRIVYLKYLEYLQKQKTQALADAEVNKKDKQTAADFKNDAENFQKRYDEMKIALDEVGKKIGEINKAAKAAGAAATPPPAEPKK